MHTLVYVYMIDHYSAECVYVYMFARTQVYVFACTQVNVFACTQVNVPRWGSRGHVPSFSQPYFRVQVRPPSGGRGSIEVEEEESVYGD